ncbi:hypothetical protein AB0L00_04790 [Actinoallomurus sp. NPDC052308]|uniref:hypothetical protein n=1 Tax=Actinoallomurus sp. NPDC052308 TaxID=3155530 RepID=UPI003432619C
MSATDHSAAPIAEPTPAELVRSVLVAARSLTLNTEVHRVDLVGLHSPAGAGRLLLTVPAGSHVGAEVARAPGGDLAASLEFTDVAPVPLPDRVRARVLLGGWLSFDQQSASAEDLCFETVTAELQHEGRWFELEVDELAAVEPDPLAATEAELLTHLAGAHGDAVELLAQLVDPRLLLGVTRVDPCGWTATASSCAFAGRAVTATYACPSPRRRGTRPTPCCRCAPCWPGRRPVPAAPGADVPTGAGRTAPGGPDPVLAAKG